MRKNRQPRPRSASAPIRTTRASATTVRPGASPGTSEGLRAGPRWAGTAVRMKNPPGRSRAYRRAGAVAPNVRTIRRRPAVRRAGRAQGAFGCCRGPRRRAWEDTRPPPRGAPRRRRRACRRSTIGVREKWESALITRQTSNPVIRSAPRRETRSGRSRRMTPSASPPLPAESTRHWVRRSTFSAIPRKSPESSTRRMDGMGGRRL